MSGLEVIGAVSELTSLLNTAITWFNYVVVANQADLELQSHKANLDHQQLRLTCWGRAAGLEGLVIKGEEFPKTSESFHLEEEQEQLAIQTVHAVAALFEECQKICHSEDKGKKKDDTSVRETKVRPRWNFFKKTRDITDGSRNKVSLVQRVKFVINKDRLEKLIKGIKDHIDNLYKIPEIRPSAQKVDPSQDNDRFLEYLGVSDPRNVKTSIRQTRGDPLKKSYGWILDHPDFRQWRNDDDTRLLWIKGDPGKGKTMLLCGIIDELEPETKLGKPKATNLLSYFFCQATVPKLSNAQAILRGLIYMLVNKQQPSLRSHVRDKFKDTGEPRFAEAEAWPALCNVFLDILRDLNMQKVYLVVDALDECIEDQDKLLKFVTQEAQLPRVKWIITSRNTVTQSRRLDEFQLILSLELQGNAEAVSQAIDAYIAEKTSQIQSLQDDPRLKEHVERVLQSKAEGTFLWVALVVQELENVDSYDVEQVVNEVPKGLDELYARMMDQIGRLQRRDPEYCRHVLLAATLAYRPLQLLELGAVAGLPDAISGNADNIRKIISKSGSFLTVRDETVVFVHKSAKDYLESKGASIIIPSGRAAGHHFIFQRSLDAMTKPCDGRSLLRRDIYGLSNPATLIDNVQAPNPDPLASIRYSCEFWADHLCFSDDEDPSHSCLSLSPESLRDLMDDGKVLKFLREHLLHWLEALSLMRKLSQGMASIRKLLLAAQLQTNSALGLIRMLKDAERFVLSHGTIMGRAPLQIYGSALAFSPTSSEVREQFWKERYSFIKSVVGIGEGWSAHRQTLEGHSQAVRAVSFSPDGKTIASGSSDCTIRLWDTATGAYQQTLKGHSELINTVAFSPHGRMLASGSGNPDSLGPGDNTVRLWDTAAGVCQQILEGHSRGVNAIAFSPDGKIVASGSGDCTIRLWDAATGAHQHILKVHIGVVYAVAFSVDGRTVASGSGDAIIRLWDTATGACRQTLEGHIFTAIFPDPNNMSAVNRISYSPHSRKYTNGAVYAVAFSPDGRTLASGSMDDTVRLWDASTGAHQQTLEGHSSSVKAVAFSPNSKIVASSSRDGTIRLWNTATGAHQILEGHRGQVEAVAFSPDGRTVASAGGTGRDRTIRFWDAATSAYQLLKGHSDPVAAVAFSPNGRIVASGAGNFLWPSDSDDCTVRLWDAKTGAHRLLEGHSGSVWAVAFSPDSKTVASGSTDCTIRLWDIATGTHKILEGHDSWILGVAFSPDGGTVASCGTDHTARLWNTATGTHQILEHSYYVTAVAFSPDGKTVASFAEKVQLWNLATGTYQILETSCDWVWGMAFSPDGQYLEMKDAMDRGGSKIERVVCLSSASGVSGYSDVSDTSTQPSSTSLFVNGDWITRDGKELLWLPPDYRVEHFSIHKHSMALGHKSGRVTILYFSSD